jgi:hypothetical protein
VRVEARPRPRRRPVEGPRDGKGVGRPCAPCHGVLERAERPAQVSIAPIVDLVDGDRRAHRRLSRVALEVAERVACAAAKAAGARRGYVHRDKRTVTARARSALAPVILALALGVAGGCAEDESSRAGTPTRRASTAGANEAGEIPVLAYHRVREDNLAPDLTISPRDLRRELGTCGDAATTPSTSAT